MCTIAGYIGKKQAAPILIEMMRTLEGFNSGYFTGISTICDGKIYYAKVVGDLDELLKSTNALDLPGNIGFIHSRTIGGKEISVEWAHPFIARKDGVPVLSHVSNGGPGYFTDRLEEIGKKADKLLEEGYDIPSKLTFENPKIKVKDGDGVHISDLTTQYVYKLLNEGYSLLKASETALMDLPSNDVDLYLSVNEPNSITFAKMSQPMMLAFCEHGAYLSSSALAIPEDAREPIILPSFTAGIIYEDHFTLKPFDKLPSESSPYDAEVVSRAYELIVNELSAEKLSYGQLRNKISSKLFPNAQCFPIALTIYEVLRALKKQGKLKLEIRRVPGKNGLAPKTYFWLE